MRRRLGISFGVFTHILFGVTVCLLFRFLKGLPGSAAGGSLGVDAALALQFAVVHSALLLPGVRRRLEWIVPPPFYGCFFCLATCVGLLLTILAWQTSPVIIWQLSGWPKALVDAAFLATWGLLIYSISLTGLGYQTGWTPWWHWFRRLPPPRRTFAPRGAYLLFRHPIYLSFMGLVWLTPTMTCDRAVLTAIWTAYIFAGSYLKDRRLIHYLGDVYRQYQARVPGYPGMMFGPLGKVRPSADSRQNVAVTLVRAENSPVAGG